jgi:hypothetical protein
MAAAEDFASEEYVFPEVSELRPAAAGRLLDAIEREAALANRRADSLRSRKKQAKAILNAVLEEYEQEGVSFVNTEGRKVTYSERPFDAYDVVDEDAFKEWAGGQAETFYGEALREGVFRDHMRRMDQDGEPLPPGVRKYSETRYSRSSALKKA